MKIKKFRSRVFVQWVKNWKKMLFSLKSNGLKNGKDFKLYRTLLCDPIKKVYKLQKHWFTGCWDLTLDGHKNGFFAQKRLFFWEILYSTLPEWIDTKKVSRLWWYKTVLWIWTRLVDGLLSYEWRQTSEVTENPKFFFFL